MVHVLIDQGETSKPTGSAKFLAVVGPSRRATKRIAFALLERLTVGGYKAALCSSSSVDLEFETPEEALAACLAQLANESREASRSDLDYVVVQVTSFDLWLRYIGANRKAGEHPSESVERLVTELMSRFDLLFCVHGSSKSACHRLQALYEAHFSTMQKLSNSLLLNGDALEGDCDRAIEGLKAWQRTREPQESLA